MPLLRMILAVLCLATSFEVTVVPLKRFAAKFNDHGHSFKSVHYSGTLLVGEPAQTFDVLFDTGSSLLWLPGSSCEASACKNHRKFVQEQSSSAQATEQYLSAEFGTGKLVGHVVGEKACFGSSCFPVDLNVADDESDFPFWQFPFDGILGLGPSLNSAVQASPVVPTLAQHGLRVFAVRLGMSSSEAVFLGDAEELPSRLVAGPVSWMPLAENALEQGFWMVDVASVRVGSKTIVSCGDGRGCQAIVDTGSSWTVGPQELVAPMRGLIGRTGLGRCRSARMPAVEFALRNGPTLRLEAEDYLDGCQVTFAPYSTSHWVLGEPVLRKYLSIFDFPQKRVGFALSAQ